MQTGAEPLFRPGVVYQGGFDTFRGRHCGYGCDDSGGHAGEEVAHGRKITCFRVGEGCLDLIEEEEADAIFSDGALGLCWSCRYVCRVLCVGEL